MATAPDAGELHDLGDSVYAYVQPDGTWGLSNAGLVVDGEASLLVDTLFDLGRTRQMLAAMRRATAAAETIDVVVNTHANGDHCWGNELVAGARIIASEAGAAEMVELPPQMLATLLRGAGGMGLLGRYVTAIFGRFEFDGITLTPPTETFSDQLTVRVGDREVQLIEVGPAHTRGDILAYVPGDRVLFTGDILFHGGHPVIWAGPIENWIAACERIAGMEVDTVVPGHGPITDKAAVRGMQRYLEYLLAEGTARYRAGMPLAEAARDIDLAEFAAWGESERVIINLAAIYRQLGATDVPSDVVALFGQMAALARERGLYGLG